MNIYVGNLPFTATAVEVREIFERYGTVDKVNLIVDRETNRTRGFCFVTMPNAKEAKAAIGELSMGARLGGRRLSVEEARERRDSRPTASGRPATPVKNPQRG